MKLRTRLSIAALATAAAAGGAGALAGTASAAPGVPSHTLGFTAAVQGADNFSQTSWLETEKDYNHANRLVGYDVLRFYFDQKQKSEMIDAAIGLKDGEIFAVIVAANSPVLHGTVTGGTGIYHRATGTITVRPSTAKEAVTITYHT